MFQICDVSLKKFINTLWSGRNQHLTANPMLNFEDGKLHIICKAKWAFICYKQLQDMEEGFGLRIYKSIFNINQEASILSLPTISDLLQKIILNGNKNEAKKLDKVFLSSIVFTGIILL